MKSIIVPPPLKKGDKVALISTARKIDSAMIIPAASLLTSWGLVVVEGTNLNAADNQFCGTDKERASDLQWALDNDEIKAIICFRGGYGTIRLLDQVDFTGLQKSPKWICGYSDVTALHNYLITVSGIASLHSTMPVNFENNTEEALRTFQCALFGEDYSIATEAHPFNRKGEAKSEIVGGNLSMIYGLTGTIYDIDTSGKILLLEDLDEYLYHIDRMMWNLKLSGKLENLKGLIVGGMTDMNDNDIPFGKSAEESILEAVKDYNYPICFGFPVGHIDDNRTLILNKECKLYVGDTTLLSYS